jgi:hypothetical protein
LNVSAPRATAVIPVLVPTETMVCGKAINVLALFFGVGCRRVMAS